MKLGARMVKTGIAVVLALYIGKWLQLEPVLFIVIAAVFATQPSIYRSFKHFLEQIQGNTIGALIGYLGVVLIGNDPLVVGLFVIIVIIINLLLKLENSIGLSILTVVIVMQAPPDDAINRFLLIALGIVISILVNALFIPPNHEKNLLSFMKLLNDRILLLLRNLLDKPFDEKTLREEKAQIVKDLEKVKQIYELYKEERNVFMYRRNKPYKLVIYKHMLKTLEIETDMILTFRKNASQILNEQIQESIMSLTHYHELIFMKFEGFIKTKSKHQTNQKVKMEHESLLEMILNHDSALPADFLLSTLNHLNKLAKQLDRLDKLVTSYIRFHKK